MEYDHTLDLCQDFSSLLENSEDYNVKIVVGKSPNVKEFDAHSIILSARSIYFRRAILKYWAKSQEEIIIKKPNVSPLIFEILLKYIYTGKLLSDDKASLVDIIIVADEFELHNVVQEVEKHLVQNKFAWKFPKDFITICQRKKFPSLYKVALELVCRNPKIIFESKEFLKMEEDYLIQLLKCDDLELEEIKIWEYLIKWGIENTDSILDNDLSKWTPMDFMNLENTLHNCISHIRFSQMSPNDYTKVRTHFVKILPRGLDDKIINYFLNSNHNSSIDDLPLRVLAYPFDSKIINAKDAALVASWVNKKQDGLYHFNSLPYEFKLIYRASSEGFSINKFHINCDNKGPTVVVIKVRNSGEIIGGYNPLDWGSAKEETSFLLSYNSDKKCETSDSFIFSLTDRAIPILSRVISTKEAIVWSENNGPCFGLQDLWIQNGFSQSRSVIGKSKQSSYEKEIINRRTKKTFEIEEYEVFQCNPILSKYDLFSLLLILLFFILLYTWTQLVIFVTFSLLIICCCIGCSKTD